MLTQIEQIALIKKYKESNDEKALQQIIETNSKIVRKVAESFIRKNSRMSYEDLNSAGIEGIIIAVRKFDPDKSDAFLPYAKLWIKVKMQEYVKSACSSVTISGRNGRKLFSNYFRYTHELEKQGIPSTPENVAKHSKVSENEIVDFVHALLPTASLQKQYDTYEEKESFVTSSTNIEKEYEQRQAYTLFNSEITNFNEKLTSQEQYIWQSRCYNSEPEKIDIISSKIGLPAKEILSIQKKMLRKFKKQILASPMKDLFHSILEN